MNPLAQLGAPDGERLATLDRIWDDGYSEQLMTFQSDTRPAILLVDDHPSNLVALEAVLGSAQYRILSARSGKEALALVEIYDVCLVLLDIQMPEMNGYEVARRLKASPRTQDVPIIFVTAIYREEPEVQRGYQMGAIDYFAKPFNTDLLKKKVEVYAELYRKNLSLREHEQEKLAMEKRLAELSQNLLSQQRDSADLTTVMESISDAIYVGDDRGITRCNSAARVMFGVDQAEEFRLTYADVAQRLHMRYPDTDGKIIPPSDLPTTHALRGEQYVTQMKIRHAGAGCDRVVGCAASPVLLESRVIGTVVINTDAGMN